MHVYDIKVLSRPALLNHSTLLFPLHIASADLVPRNADSKPRRCIAMIIQTNPTQKKASSSPYCSNTATTEENMLKHLVTEKTTVQQSTVPSFFS